jgi:outer membrane lipoprotein-sorting protein
MTGRWLIFATILFAVGGCDLLAYLDRFPLGGINLAARAPFPVEADVEKVLTEWQKHRAKTLTHYATFKRTVRDTAFKKESETTGSVRLRHGKVFRIDIKKPREVFFFTKDSEFWHLDAESRRATIHEFPKPDQAATWAATQFVWFAPTDKETLQKHGRIKKVRDTATTVELRVSSPADRRDNLYVEMTVTLRKSDYLPVKLDVKESADTHVIYEFTELHENVELPDSDFVPPKLGPEWRISRQRLVAGKSKSQSATDPKPMTP